MEELLSESHLPKSCLDTIIESPQSIEEQGQENGNSNLITTNRLSKIECATTEYLGCSLLSGLKQENFSSFGQQEKEKENMMSIEDLQEDQPADEPPADYVVEENLEKEANSPTSNNIKENPLPGSSIDQINSEEVGNIVDEILESNRIPRDEEKREASWRILRRLKKQEIDKPDSEEEEPEIVPEREIEEIVEEEPPKRGHLKKQQMKNYNELVHTMQYLSKHDWLDDSPLHQKLASSNYLTANVIWFMICAKFFPRAAFAHKNPKEFFCQRIDKVKSFIPDITERLTKLDIKNEIIQKNSLTENELIFIDSIRKAIKATSSAYTTNDYLKKTMSSRTIKSTPKALYNYEDDEWVMQTRRYLYDGFQNLKEANAFEGVELELPKNSDLMSKIDLQDLITLYEKDLYESALDNEKLLESLEQNVVQTLEEEERFNSLKIDPDSGIVDLKVDFPEDEQFISMLEKKLFESKDLAKVSLPESTIGKSAGNKRAYKFKPKIIDDMVCYVCNDGDYTDDDLIVFCSKCNISVHQQCYGIPVIPKGDWVCNVCLNFGQHGKYLRCPLCDKRGGALKPSNLRADCDLFEHLNPNYHAFLKSYVSENFIKNAPQTIFLTDAIPADINKDDDTKATTNDESDSNFSENLYYDIQFLDDKFTEEELVNEPKPLNVWVHMSCAYFIPELYFDDDDYIFNVLALETIPKDRYKYDCEICGKKRNGAIVNCGKGNCKRAFHPECARRAEYFLDIRENESNQLIYHIFCEKHTPLKLKRNLESREKKMKEEIQQFFKLVDKCRSNTLLNVNQPIHHQNHHHHHHHEPVPETNLLSNAERKIKKQEKREDADSFLSLVQKYKEMTSEDVLSAPNEQADSSDNYEPLKVQKSRLSMDRKLKADDPIWNMIPYKNFTAEEKYGKYKKIMAKQKDEKKYKDSRLEICRKNAERAREAKKMLLQQKQTHKEQVIQPEPKSKIKTKQIEKEIIIKTTTKVAKVTKTTTTTTTEKEDKNKLYCLCRKKFKGELMTACEGCEEWYHPACLGLKMPRQQLKRIKWWCNKCSTERGYENLDLYIEDGADIYVKRLGAENIEKDEPALLKKVKVNEELDSQNA